jgi:23S rRNA A1618 N6-methylase RlmF
MNCNTHNIYETILKKDNTFDFQLCIPNRFYKHTIAFFIMSSNTVRNFIVYYNKSTLMANIIQEKKNQTCLLRFYRTKD